MTISKQEPVVEELNFALPAYDQFKKISTKLIYKKFLVQAKKNLVQTKKFEKCEIDAYIVFSEPARYSEKVRENLTLPKGMEHLVPMIQHKVEFRKGDQVITTKFLKGKYSLSRIQDEGVYFSNENKVSLSLPLDRDLNLSELTFEIFVIHDSC